MGQGREQKKKKKPEVNKGERDSVEKKPPSAVGVGSETGVTDEEMSQSTDEKVIAPDGYPATKKEEPPLF